MVTGTAIKQSLTVVIVLFFAKLSYSKALVQKVDSLNALSTRMELLTKLGKKDSIRILADEALAQAKQIGDHRLITDFNFYLGVPNQLRNRQTSLKYYKIAYDLADSLDYPLMKVRSAMNIGNLLKIVGVCDSAFTTMTMV